MPLDAILFDLDGTVWDSAPGIVNCLEHAFTALGLPVPPPEVLGANIGPALQDKLAELGMPAELVAEGVRIYRSRYTTHGAYEASLYPGMAELLEDLAADPTIPPLATATSKGEGPTLQMLDHFNLRRHFTAVGAASMDGVRTSKTAVIEDVVGRLGAPERCVHIGDRHYDVTGAAASDLPCIGVAWGYGDRAELEEAGAVAVAGNAEELADLLRSW